jgi:multicomponent Na+:H+ antiporter subunit B
LRWAIIAILVLFAGLLLYAEGGLPARGSIEAPASVYLSPYYIEHTIEDTETPNVVTSVLADYRGYDTLGETTVIFTAGLACILVFVLGGVRGRKS